MEIMQKYIDLTEPGAIYDLNASIAYGWYIKEKLNTLIILEYPQEA